MTWMCSGPFSLPCGWAWQIKLRLLCIEVDLLFLPGQHLFFLLWPHLDVAPRTHFLQWLQVEVYRLCLATSWACGELFQDCLLTPAHGAEFNKYKKHMNSAKSFSPLIPPATLFPSVEPSTLHDVFCTFPETFYILTNFYVLFSQMNNVLTDLSIFVHSFKRLPGFSLWGFIISLTRSLLSSVFCFPK